MSGLAEILEGYKQSRLSLEKACEALSRAHTAHLGHTAVDLHRQRRIGYGASFGGVTALLGMLNSCASAVSVFNIDNGFGAGYIASLINRANMPQ